MKQPQSIASLDLTFRESCKCPTLSSINPYEEFKKYQEKIRALALQESEQKRKFTEVVISAT